MHCHPRVPLSRHGGIKPYGMTHCEETKRPRNLYFPWPFGFILNSIIAGKKLIESPLGHGTNVPCCFNDGHKGEEIHNAHGMNIIKLPEPVK